MANKEIVLGMSSGITVTSVTVTRIQYLTDDSGNWQIDFGINLGWPTRTPNADVVLRETSRIPYAIVGTVIITGDDIAATAGIERSTVRTALTLEQTETLISQIALGKVFAVLGIKLA